MARIIMDKEVCLSLLSIIEWLIQDTDWRITSKKQLDSGVVIDITNTLDLDANITIKPGKSPYAKTYRRHK